MTFATNNIHTNSLIRDQTLSVMMGHLEQSIQEWTKQNLWKTAFKKYEGIWSA